MSDLKKTMPWQLKLAGYGVMCGCTAHLLGKVGSSALVTGLWTTSGVLVGGALAPGICRLCRPVARGVWRAWRRSKGSRRRQIYRAPGWAGPHDFATVLGAGALRAKADQIRPSLAGAEKRWSRGIPPLELGQYLGRAVTGSRLVRGRKAYADFEQSLIVIAPPGAGKTAFIIHGILDAPGAILATSTKPDLYLLTHELRAKRGPVALFNPQNVGNIAGNFRWDPLMGCEDYQVARKRATALVEGTKAITGIQETSWAAKCTDILSYYLTAAKLAGKDMHTVDSWLSDAEDDTAVRILRHFADQLPQGLANSLEAEMRSKADKMSASIWSLLRGSVAFMANPLVAAACSKGAGTSFDAGEFARCGGTLYLLGEDSDATITPLLNALTSYIYDEVKKTANASPGNRLDPPFGFFLDEVTKITPVPLAKWAADGRGHGIYITAVTQSFDQIRERWGNTGLGSIKNLFSKVILGKLQNMTDLRELSDLVGDREVDAVSTGWSWSTGGSTSHSQSRSSRREPILLPHDIRTLPPGHALIITGPADSIITRYQKGQVRAQRELKKLRKDQHKQRLLHGSRVLGTQAIPMPMPRPATAMPAAAAEQLEAV